MQMIIHEVSATAGTMKDSFGQRSRSPYSFRSNFNNNPIMNRADADQFPEDDTMKMSTCTTQRPHAEQANIADLLE